MKTITITLNGKDRVLDVGKWYFTKYLGECDVPADNSLKSSFEWSVALVWAGMMTDCKARKVEPDFTKQDVEEWLGVLEGSDIEAIVNKYNEAVKPGE